MIVYRGRNIIFYWIRIRSAWIHFPIIRSSCLQRKITAMASSTHRDYHHALQRKARFVAPKTFITLWRRHSKRPNAIVLKFYRRYLITYTSSQLSISMNFFLVSTYPLMLISCRKYSARKYWLHNKSMLPCVFCGTVVICIHVVSDDDISVV